MKTTNEKTFDFNDEKKYEVLNKEELLAIRGGTSDPPLA
jgi:hypothetical protein